MVVFTESLEDDNLKEKLWIALNGRGAFRRFKNERLEKRVMEWLEENEIELA